VTARQLFEMKKKMMMMKMKMIGFTQ